MKSKRSNNRVAVICEKTMPKLWNTSTPRFESSVNPKQDKENEP